jgi:ribosome-associated toxin RatA of RatAB toxin-antitoxin module
MYDRNEMATSPFRRLDDEDLDPTEEMNLADLGNLVDRSLTATLPVNAQRAYEIFCDVEQIIQWVSVVTSVRVLEANPRGRAQRAAFIASLARASVGYTLEYEYREPERVVSWWTPDAPAFRVGGRAQFDPLGDRACLMHYELHLDLPEGALPPWGDSYFDGHAPSTVLGDFRDYLNRIAKKLS